MNHTHTTAAGLVTLAALGLTLGGCGESDHGHDHGSEPHEHAEAATTSDEAHDHETVALDAVTIGDMALELAQGDGPIRPGQDSYLSVKLPYNDNGATIVRAWLGTDDRTLSYVGKGEYAPSHDDYDLHATAPDPLPENTMWWIEIEKPDGTKAVGSTKPLTD